MLDKILRVEGIQRDVVTLVRQGAIVIAGGGGGAGLVSQQYLDEGIRTNGGAAAWPDGSDGGGGPNAPGPSGGNQTAAGVGGVASRNTGGDGDQFAGGVSYLSGNEWYGGGAGGAGWFGGGGGGNFGPASLPGYTAGGGGGSSYYNATMIQNFTYQNGLNASAPANDDSDYQSGIGEGATGGMQPTPNGGAGLIVILYEPETSIRFWAIDMGLGNINDQPPSEGTDDDGIDAPPTLTAVAELVDSAIEFIMTDPESAAAATSASGGVALYVLFFRRSKGERKKMVSSIKGLGETAAFDARLRALKVLTGSRTLALIFGPLAWTWDELVFGLVEARLAVYGVSEVVTTEGLAQYLVFEVMGLSFTTPEALHGLLPHIRNIATFLFVFFLYLTFFTRGSLYKEAKVLAGDQTEEVEAAAAAEARAAEEARRREQGADDGDDDGFEDDDGSYRYDDGEQRYDDGEHRYDERHHDDDERHYDDSENRSGKHYDESDNRFDEKSDDRYDERPKERYDERYEEDYDKPSGPRRGDSGRSDNSRGEIRASRGPSSPHVDDYDRPEAELRPAGPSKETSRQNRSRPEFREPKHRVVQTPEFEDDSEYVSEAESEQEPEHDEFWHSERFSNLADEVEAAAARPAASKADLFAKALDSADSSDSVDLDDSEHAPSDDFAEDDY